VPFESEHERTAEGLRRDLERERQAHEKAQGAATRAELEVKRLNKELDRLRADLERWKPGMKLPLGWFRMPVLAALALLAVAIATLVGTVLSTIEAKDRAAQLEHERDVLAKAANRESAARQAAQTAERPATVGCLSACGCPDGQGCVGETCREGVSPAHCCDRPNCPSGAPCQHWDGSEAVCP
jgi:hypothetical protein